MVAPITGLVVPENQRHFGANVVILLPEPLPTVQSEEVLETCCVRIIVTCILIYVSYNKLFILAID